MKICFLIDAPWDKWGGGQEHVTRVARDLEKDYGYTVDIIHPQKINPKFNFLNFLDRIWFAFWVVKFLLLSDHDIYHSHTFSTSAFLPLAWLRGKKTALTLHGAGKDLIGGGILNKLGIPKLLSWLILEVWPINFHFTAGGYKDFIKVGNGVDVAEYDKVDKIKHKGFRVFWLGRKFDPIKGLRYLEEATRDIDVELDIQDAIFGEEKIKHFKMADVYVLPSLSEGFPIVLLEAMAAKLPVITTDVGDCRKLVEEAKCGLVIPPGDVNALREAIKGLIGKKNSYGENGYKFVKNNYSWDKVAAIYNSYYRKLNSKL